jgi:glycosyltransferase involved in cell wall biosynthesis
MKTSVSHKKILIVCSHFWPSVGGLESRMGQFSTELVNAGYAVTVLTQALPNRTSNDYHGVTIADVDGVRFTASIRATVASGEFDTCILIQDPLGVIIWSVEGLTLPSHTRLLIQPIINEDGYSRWKDNAEFRGRLGNIFRAADTALVMTKSGPDTRFMRSENIEHTYLPNATTQVQAAGDFREQYGIAPDAFLVLHIANLYWVKNHIGLIDALPDMPPSWKLVMVGNVSGETDCSEAVRAKLATRPEILFIPGLSREWVAAAMQAADTVVLASKGEGSPITILEAMSHQTPWLATPECGAANDHVGGIICELQDFKAHLQVLADKPALRRSLGEISYAHWNQCYSWPVAIRGWVDLIEQGRLQRPFELDQALRSKMEGARNAIAVALRNADAGTSSGGGNDQAATIDFDIFRVDSYRSGPIRFGWLGDVNASDMHEILVPAMGDEFHVTIANDVMTPVQMAAFFNVVDVLLICSDSAALSGRLSQAMACGVFPVIVDTGHAAASIVHLQQGYLAERTVAAFRAAMHWCAFNSPEVRKIGYRNAQQVAIGQC